MTSIGKVLSEIEITKESVVKQIMTVKNKVDLGFLGFRDGENKFTYPRFDEDKVSTMLVSIGELCDYLIIDCTSSLSNPISGAAVKTAGQVIRLASPDLSSVSFFSSQLRLYADTAYRLNEQITGLNTPDSDLFMPIEEAKKRIPDVRFTIPYCREVKQQMLNGKLYAEVADKKFNEKLRAIAEKVV